MRCAFRDAKCCCTRVTGFPSPKESALAPRLRVTGPHSRALVRRAHTRYAVRVPGWRCGGQPFVAFNLLWILECLLVLARGLRTCGLWIHVCRVGHFARRGWWWGSGGDGTCCLMQGFCCCCSWPQTRVLRVGRRLPTRVCAFRLSALCLNCSSGQMITCPAAWLLKLPRCLVFRGRQNPSLAHGGYRPQ